MRKRPSRKHSTRSISSCGRARRFIVGVSNYPPNEFNAVCKLAERKKSAPIVLLQSRYNMLERALEAISVPRKRKRCGRSGFFAARPGFAHNQVFRKRPGGIASRQSLERGPARGENQRSRPAPRPGSWTRSRTNAARLCAQMALAWTLRDPMVTSALVGASTVEQIEENVRALENLNFSAEELRRIDAALKS